MNSKRKIEINIVEVQTYKILIQINSIAINLHFSFELFCTTFVLLNTFPYNIVHFKFKKNGTLS